MDKSIIMLFRGKNDSNKISSATSMAIEKDRCGNDIGFKTVNIDKVNILKYLSKLPNQLIIIYVWHEDVDIIESINEKYPDLELRIYSLETSTERESSRKLKYILAKQIIDEYKLSQGTIEKWVVENLEVKKVILFTCDYKYLNVWTQKKYFPTEKEANEYKVKEVKSEIERAEEMIEYYRRKIVDLKEGLK